MLWTISNAVLLRTIVDYHHYMIIDPFSQGMRNFHKQFGIRWASRKRTKERKEYASENVLLILLLLQCKLGRNNLSKPPADLRSLLTLASVISPRWRESSNGPSLLHRGKLFLSLALLSTTTRSTSLFQCEEGFYRLYCLNSRENSRSQPNDPAEPLHLSLCLQCCCRPRPSEFSYYLHSCPCVQSFSQLRWQLTYVSCIYVVICLDDAKFRLTITHVIDELEERSQYLKGIWLYC